MFPRRVQSRILAMATIAAIALAVTAQPAHAQYGFGFGGFGFGGGGPGVSFGITAFDQEAMMQQYYALGQSRFMLETAQANQAFQSAQLSQQRAISVAIDNEKRWMELRQAYNIADKKRVAEQAQQLRDMPQVDLGEYFDSNGKMHWPAGASTFGDIGPLRDAAEAAMNQLYQESKSSGKVRLRTAMEAKDKLNTYGQRALRRLRNRRPDRGEYAELLSFLQTMELAINQLAARV